MEIEELQALVDKRDRQIEETEKLIKRVVLEIVRTRGILANGYSTPELDKEVKGSDGYSVGQNEELLDN